MTVRLSRLLDAAGIPHAPLAADPEVTGVTHDSRDVAPGKVFVAIQGVPLPARAPLDGHDFIRQAVAAGAAAVVGSRELTGLAVPYVAHDHPRAALADLSAAFHGHPARRLTLAGVTGSKGKTTTTVLLHHLLQSAGIACGRVASVGIASRDREWLLPGHFTTPEAPQLHEALASFLTDGCTHAVLEVSSHALALERVRGIGYAVGVWTNLEPEHLDLHGTMEAYAREKAKLLERSAFAVTNATDPLIPRHQGWSFADGGDWTASDVREGPDGLRFDVRSPLGKFPVFVPMVGAFNVLNALAAMAAAARLGVDTDALRGGLASFKGVPGRMQLVQAQPFRVIVDFAHTEASLRAALTTVRATTAGRVLLVVGAAGERDPSRRTGLARVAAEHADHTYFTEEDHRGESLDAILETMAHEARKHRGSHELVPDRGDAIRRAVRAARPGDTVVLAGKGHERTIERGSQVLPWDEAAVAREALSAIA
ncbi:MAG TPA: UDP-N-acetylmuramoyl-L-alanyl-D-glutamate--2,6-diaminopimelate ligase [Deinococcales bacterium]|nr:UDP-N-acetylmuramoyl-L-alanyl-D-glutamate--2,6-diaminopimelate ligase [Deinococcales bacterium]